MKAKNITIIALVLLFNDFVGAVVREAGILFARLGSYLQCVPDFF
jgi:hypothetical protein